MFLKVAAVSGPDGFSYLLGKLVSAFATDQGRHEAAASASLNEALGRTLKHCIATPSLKLAVTEGLCQASSQDLSLQHLANCTDLTSEQQLSLALNACSSASSFWKQQGTLFLPACVAMQLLGNQLL